MNDDSSERSILVTGCSSGIGACVAYALNDRGYRVLATVRKEDDRSPLQARGIDSFLMDYADSDSVQNTARAVLDATDGNLYALFNNGAYGQPGACEDLPRAALRKQFESNFFGWVELTNCILPSMRANNRGRIIQNSSILGFVAMPMRGAYNASKFAIEGFSDTLRLELQGSGIHISLIEPGPIESQFRANAYQAFLDNMNPEDSPHQERYKKMLRRVNREGSPSAFTLPPEAVLKRVIHALESPKPKIRYPVTTPTYVFSWLKRICSDRLLDRMLAKIN
ncbi:MAG: SDR family oxidoreductase [Pseudomonadota bacterium]